MSPFPLCRAAACAVVLVLLPAAACAGQITVFAAASMKNALDNVAADWEAETGNRAVISYAGSSALAKQIIEGAPADIFISASTAWMDAVEAEGAVDPATRRDLLGNALVLVGAADAAPLTLGPDTDLPSELAGGKLAMAMVDAVPAGVYGKQALTSLGLWESVAPHVAQAENVRAALALVSTGEAPMGIVYATDAHADANVGVRATFPANSHDPITYPVARVTGSQAEEAAAFLDFLHDPQARADFEAEGFTVLDR